MYLAMQRRAFSAQRVKAYVKPPKHYPGRSELAVQGFNSKPPISAQ